MGLIWTENAAVARGLHEQLYKNILAQLGAAPQWKDAKVQTSTNSAALMLDMLSPAVTGTCSRDRSIKRRKTVGQKSMSSAERIHMCRLFLCLQWQELVPQEWLFPTQGEPKLTPKDSRGIQTYITEENQLSAFVWSTMRISESVQGTCDPQKKQY